jgi:hypothetical protein
VTESDRIIIPFFLRTPLQITTGCRPLKAASLANVHMLGCVGSGYV